MSSFFIACTALGAFVLVLQILLSLLGMDHDHADGLHIEEGLNLLSVRTISAGIAIFGIGGLLALEIGLPTLLAVTLPIIPAFLAMLGTAWLTRAMLGFEHSGSLRIAGAIGQSGTVHLSVPAHGAGAGKVQFQLQGRTIEMKAISPDNPILSGTPVTIVGVLDEDTVEVVPTPTLKEIFE